MLECKDGVQFGSFLLFVSVCRRNSQGPKLPKPSHSPESSLLRQDQGLDSCLFGLQNVTLASEGAASLDLRLDLGVITADDAMRAGVADALAARLLSNIQKLIAPLASAVEQRQAAKAAGLPGESVADLAKEMSKTVSSL